MSRSEGKARSYAERHGIGRWYKDAQELIDDDEVNAVYVATDDEVNAVYVATPPSSHATYAIMAMKAGKPVYVEKPLASSYEDCLRINRVSEETGIPCFCAYYRRQLPYFEKVKEIVERGVIGQVVNVQVRFAVPPREADYAADGKLPWRLQPHVAHESACEDRIHLVGNRGAVSFSVFDYQPIHLYTMSGEENFVVPNPPYVQAPLIKNVIEHLQGIGVCNSTSQSATPVNWALDCILGKF